VAEPVRVRRLTDQEGQKLQQIVRRGSTSSVHYRRAMMLLASAGGNRVPVIAQLVQADEDTVRDVIHRFNEIGLACLDPNSLLTASAAGATRAGLFERGTTTPFWTLADEASTESGVGSDAHGGGRVGCRTDASGGPGLDVSQQSGDVRRLAATTVKQGAGARGRRAHACPLPGHDASVQSGDARRRRASTPLALITRWCWWCEPTTR